MDKSQGGRAEDLGARLRETRRKLGMSQTELAGAELSPSYVSLIESGKRVPTPPVLALLAARLGSDPDYLLEGTDVRAREERNLRLRYAELSLQNGEAAEALSHFRQLESEADEDSGLQREARWGIARALEALGQLEEAVDEYDRFRESAERDPVSGGAWAEAVIAVCRCSLAVGDLSRAIELGEAALRRFSELELDGSEIQAQVASTLVFAYYQRGDLVRAQNIARELIRIVESNESRIAKGAAYWNASLVAESRGQLGDALALAERALAMYAESDRARAMARLKVAFAWLLLRQPEPALDRAATLLTEARSELSDTGSAMDIAMADTELARICLLAGDEDGAIETAHRVLDGIGDARLESARALLVIGEAMCQTGNLDGGKQQVARAAQAMAAHSERDAAGAWREAGDLLERLGDPVAAIDAYQRALGLLGVSSVPLPARSSVSAG
jgi:transcriptional regulator with XRE-family HTH domain